MGGPGDSAEARLERYEAENAALRVQNQALTGIVAQQTEIIARLTSAPPAPPATPAAPPPAPGALVVWDDLWEPYVEENGERIESSASDSGRWKHISRHCGKKAVIDTTVATLRDYRRERRKEITKRKAKPAPKTLNNEVELKRRVARWAFRRKRIPVDPFACMTQEEIFEPVENVRRNVVEDDPQAHLTLEQFLEQADPFERALVLTAHSSGMRRGEIAVLEMPWIDRTPDAHGRPLRIVRIPPGVSKGRRGRRKGRETFIRVEALEAIDAYRRTLPFPLQRRAVHVFVNGQTLKDGRPGKHYGNHLHKDYLTQRFKRLQEKAGATGPSGPAWLHDLRRSFITLARRRNEDTSNIMKVVGQTTLSSFRRYDIHARQDVLNVRDRIEAARDAELAALAEARKGPQRAAVDGAEHELEKNNQAP